MSWAREAACKGMDTGLFFPVGVTGPAEDQAAQAKAVCGACAVRPDCLEFALETGSEGIWVGTDEDERRNLRRAPSASTCPASSRSRSHDSSWRNHE